LWLAHGVLDYFVHLHLVADRGWGLAVLHVVDIEVLLVLMDVVLAPPRSGASGVAVDAANAVAHTLLGVVDVGPSRIVVVLELH